jgi:hypothetical protein
MRDPKSREKYPNIRGHSTTLPSSRQNSYTQYKKHVKQGGTRGGHATRVQNLIHTLFKMSSIYSHPPTRMPILIEFIYLQLRLGHYHRLSLVDPSSSVIN